jgi:hypothetical protein
LHSLTLNKFPRETDLSPKVTWSSVDGEKSSGMRGAELGNSPASRREGMRFSNWDWDMMSSFYIDDIM